MVTQSQFIASLKSLFQPPGQHSGIQDPEHLEQWAFKSKNHILVPSSYGERFCTSKQFNRS